MWITGGFTGLMDVHACLRLKENLWRAAERERELAGSPLSMMQDRFDCCK